MLKTIALFALLFSLPIAAQVQLGGHVYVPSTTDSTNGFANVTITANGVCIVVSQTNCTLTTFSGAPFDASLPYVGTLAVNDPNNLLTGDTVILLPISPGREYNVINDTSQTLDFTGVKVTTSQFVASIFSEGDEYFSSSCVNDTGGFLLEISTVTSLCANSPIDDGISNTGFLTSTKGLVFPYLISSPNSTSSFAGSSPLNSSPGQSDVFIAVANIHDSKRTANTATGTLFNPNVAAAAVSLSTPDTNSPGCVNLWADSGFGDPVLVLTASFCDGSITFNEPISGPPTATPTCNANGCFRHELDGSITEWGTVTASTTSETVQTVPIVFPLPFPTSTTLTVSAGSGPDGTSNVSMSVYHINKTLTGATVVLRCASNIGGSGCPSISNSVPVDWHAIGN